MSKKITLNHITKVEGHGSLNVEIERGKVKKCELMAIEGARFFEGLVKGKKYTELKEITSRICGICSCSHTLASISATENGLGVEVSEQVILLRELLAIGERIRSHATHLYFLALPDFTGHESAIAMAKNYKKEFARALKLVQLGNNIVEMIGGREMHPVSPVIGGFTHIPDKESFQKILQRLKDSRDDAIRTAKLFSSIKVPSFERKTEYLSLKQTDAFPLNTGRIVSTKGLNFDSKSYTRFIQEYLEDYATSKFAVKKGKGYMIGALSRVNNNVKLLTKTAETLFMSKKLSTPIYNPFMNNLAQAVETVHWIERSIEILEQHSFKKEERSKIRLKAGRGVGVVEAPRGLLFHDYTYNSQGVLEKANIITPTAQNLRNMEDDIKAYLPTLLNKKKEDIVLDIEKLIRAYDPCFSCSTHFLKVDWKES